MLLICFVHLSAVFTVVLSEWRTKFRREMNNANNDQDAASVDSILNFETVKYHAAEDFETQRYAVAVDKLLVCTFSLVKHSFVFTGSLHLLGVDLVADRG